MVKFTEFFKEYVIQNWNQLLISAKTDLVGLSVLIETYVKALWAK